MDFVRALLVLLFLAGLVLPVCGAVRAIRHAGTALAAQTSKIERTRALNAKMLQEFAVEGNDSEEISNRYAAIFDAEGLVKPGYLDYEDASAGEAAIMRTLKIAFAGNGLSAALIIIGLVASTVASIWSLFLPPA